MQNLGDFCESRYFVSNCFFLKFESKNYFTHMWHLKIILSLWMMTGVKMMWGLARMEAEGQCDPQHFKTFPNIDLSLSNARWVYNKKCSEKKSVLTEDWLNRSEMWCAVNNCNVITVFFWKHGL